MPEKHYVLHGIKHRFPSKEISRAVNLPCHGHIEQWPLYATSRHNATTTTKIVKNRRVKIVTMNDFEESLQPKPKFLAFLEAHIRKEKEYRGVSNSGISLTRLQIFRETFDYLIEAFSSYRPILSKIKKEYEEMLNHYAKQITLLEPLKEKVYFFAADCDQKIIEMREEEKADYYKLLKVNEDLKSELRHRDLKVEDLKFQIEKLSETISELYESLRKEQDARNVLVLSKRDDSQPSDSKINEAECNRIRIENEKMKITVIEAKKAHEDALCNVMKLHCDYADVIPRCEYDRLLNELHDTAKELQLMTEKNKKLSNEKKETEQLCAAAIGQRNDYYMKLMQTKTGQKADWMSCVEVLANSIQSLEKYDQELSYADLVDFLYESFILSDIDESGSSSKEPNDTKRERQLSLVKKKLGNDSYHGARMLAEIIASYITNQNVLQAKTNT